MQGVEATETRCGWCRTGRLGSGKHHRNQCPHGLVVLIRIMALFVKKKKKNHFIFTFLKNNLHHINNFYYYSNKKNYYNTNFFYFSISILFYFISHHIYHFLLIPKLTTHYYVQYSALPNKANVVIINIRIRIMQLSFFVSVS
jgi:hypothetical protein